MATKPTTTFTLATNTNYSVGPLAGFATKVVPADIPNGFTPGQGVQPEPVNYCLHYTGKWITDWLDLGSSAADLDAHIVETDGTGEAKIASARIGATASAARALYADANSGASSATAEVVNTFGGYALLASTALASAAIRAVQSGTADAIQAVSIGSGSAVDASCSGSAPSVLAASTGGAPTSVGLYCSATSTYALYALGPSSVSAAAGYCEARHATAYGLVAYSDASSTTGGGLHGIGRGTGTAVYGQNLGTGYGVTAQADTTTPVRAPLRVVPQDADPSSGADGDITYSSTLDQPRMYADARWQAPWVTTKGHAHGVANVIAGPINNTDAGSYTDIVTCTIAAPNDPKTAGVILLYAAADFGDEVGSTFHETIDVRIYDITSAAVVWSATIANIDRGAGPANLCPRGWSAVVPYTTPAAGPREFRLQFKRTTDIDPSDGVVARNGCLDALGVFGV